MTDIIKFDAQKTLAETKDHFKILEDYQREAFYASQLLEKNSYLMDIAKANPKSLVNAVINVSKIGISLNPNLSHAYLVPRAIKGQKMIVLDISYRGLCKIATDSGCIKFVQAMIVKKNDVFKRQGIDKEPLHEFDPFAERGEIVGVYCVAKTNQNDFLTEVMSIADVEKIKLRSEAAKSKTGPWFTDYEEMVKKTIIKRASKMWPIGDGKLFEAIEVVNEHEGINFQDTSRAINQSELVNLENLCSLVDDGEKRVLKYVTNLHNNEIVFTKLEDFSEMDYLKSVDQLTQKINKGGKNEV